MKIGYLVNTYPMTSQTFIRREINALEAQGVEVVRYAIRRWHEGFVDDQDAAERSRTRYILTGRSPALVGDFIVEALKNPLGMLRAAGLCLRLIRNAGGGIVRHAAYLLEAATLKRWTDRDQVSALHCHFATNATTVALLCSKLGGPPYSFTAHGQEETDNWDRTSLRDKVLGARFVVAISHYCRVQLARASGMSVWNKLHVVRCGIDVGEFQPCNAPFENNANFVCVGRLCPEKAQTLLIEALSIVARKHPQVRLLLVGDGETRGEVEAAITRLEMQPYVTLMGWRSNAEVREIMGRARAVLLPSVAEGLPIVLMEALALQRPVITTFVAGIPELVGSESGWIVPAGSPVDTARAMIAALEAPSATLETMGAEGRSRVIESHDVHRNAAKLRELFFGVRPSE